MKRDAYATVVLLLAGGVAFGVAAVAVLDGVGAVALLLLTVGVSGSLAGVEGLRHVLDEARYQGRREGFHEAIGRRPS